MTSEDLPNRTPKTGNDSKSQQTELYQIKIFNTLRDTTNPVEDAPTEWEKMSTNCCRRTDVYNVARIQKPQKKTNSLMDE